MVEYFQPKMQLAVCNNCHKLHNAKDIIAYKKEGQVAIMSCLHKEYPNNLIPSRRYQCDNTLSVLKKKRTKNCRTSYIVSKTKHSATIKHAISTTRF